MARRANNQRQYKWSSTWTSLNRRWHETGPGFARRMAQHLQPSGAGAQSLHGHRPARMARSSGDYANGVIDGPTHRQPKPDAETTPVTLTFAGSGLILGPLHSFYPLKYAVSIFRARENSADDSSEAVEVLLGQRTGDRRTQYKYVKQYYPVSDYRACRRSSWFRRCRGHRCPDCEDLFRYLPCDVPCVFVFGETRQGTLSRPECALT